MISCCCCQLTSASIAVANHISKIQAYYKHHSNIIWQHISPSMSLHNRAPLRWFTKRGLLLSRDSLSPSMSLHNRAPLRWFPKRGLLLSRCPFSKAAPIEKQCRWMFEDFHLVRSFELVKIQKNKTWMVKVMKIVWKCHLLLILVFVSESNIVNISVAMWTNARLWHTIET
jgi:hypothetical protein